MNMHLAESDLATPKVTTGPITGSRKIYTAPEAAPDLKVPLREIALDASSGEPVSGPVVTLGVAMLGSCMFIVLSPVFLSLQGYRAYPK